MPAKALIVSQKADKHFLKLPIRIQKKAIRAYDILKQNPVTGVRLQGVLDGFYKYRLGDYRIIYSFETKISTVIVVAIEHRQGVYK